MVKTQVQDKIIVTYSLAFSRNVVCCEKLALGRAVAKVSPSVGSNPITTSNKCLITIYYF